MVCELSKYKKKCKWGIYKKYVWVRKLTFGLEFCFIES